jgi:hypothetical protein
MKKITLPEAKFYPLAVPEKWDNIEIESVWDDGEGNVEVTDDPESISYWSIYLHDVDGGVSCIADLTTEAEALVLKDLLTSAVKNYINKGYLN